MSTGNNKSIMKKHSNYLYFLFIILMTACTKDGGYYNEEVQKIKFNGTIYDYLLSKHGVFDSLVKVVGRTEMEKLLKESNNITLFAPTNQSFKIALDNLNNTRKKADKPMEYINNVDILHLDTMMSQYLIRGYYPTDSMLLKDGINLFDYKNGYPMNAKVISGNSSGYLKGGPVIIQYSDTKRSQFTRNWVTATTESINIQADNGIVHVLAPDHVFGFNDFVNKLTYIPPPPNLFVTVGGKFSVSRENSGGPNAVEASKYVFDGNPETKYLISAMNNPEWMQVELNSPSVANAYTLTSANDFPTRDPADWQLQASHNGTDWVTLDSRNSEEFTSRFQQRVFFINNTVAYKFYRLRLIRVRSGVDMQLADWSVNKHD